MATKPTISINPNSSKHAVFNADLTQENVYPRFVLGVDFDHFRHIEDLKISFKAPITVVAGSNRSGKTTLLLSLACSHFEFNKRNYANGKLDRQTWSRVLKFTPHDLQEGDWAYFLNIKTGAKTERRRGQRKADTKKWNGLGKKESQIKGVQVVYLDLDRILPARYHSSVLHQKAMNTVASNVSTSNQADIDACISYVLEEKYSLRKLADHLGRDLLAFSAENNYSSYNSASGEDVLSRIIIDCVEAPKNALVLIDEVELGLHPKIQRRLMDVIFEISRRDAKQFIVTTHSSTIIAAVPDSARIFIDNRANSHRAISPISINAALTQMDAESYPLVDIFCEDWVASKIIHKAILEVSRLTAHQFNRSLFNVIISGSAADTFQNFEVQRRIYDKVKIRSGYACILDGDMRQKKNKDGVRLYPAQDFLTFLPGASAPEKWLTEEYEQQNPNGNFAYHVGHSNVHCLFEKLCEFYDAEDKHHAFELCWNAYISQSGRSTEFGELVEFLTNLCHAYAPSL